VAVNTVIILISFSLCVYWFRYLCLLILRDRGGRNHARQIASANHLVFLRARALLADRDDFSDAAASVEVMPHTLAKLERSLDHDYKVVTYLLNNTAESCLFRPAEQVVLWIDFHLMRVCYRVFRGVSRRMAKDAVLEMALIVGYLAKSAGEQVVARKA
jgi:hypothetical protein